MDPNFVKRFVVEPKQEKRELQFNVYKSSSETLKPSNLVGGVKVSLDDLLGQLNGFQEFQLSHVDSKINQALLKDDARLVLTCCPVDHGAVIPENQIAKALPQGARATLRSQIDVMKEGREFVKYPFGSGKPTKKNVFFVADNQWGVLYWCEAGKRVCTPSKSMPISHITHIIVGKRTPAFLMSDQAQASWASRCFSLVSTMRTLDLEAPTSGQCTAWVNGIADLTKKGGAQGARIQRLPTFHKKHSCRELTRDTADPTHQAMEVWIKLEGLPKKHPQSKAGILIALLERDESTKQYQYFGQMGWAADQNNSNAETQLLVGYRVGHSSEFRLNFYHVADTEKVARVTETDRFGSSKHISLECLQQSYDRTMSFSLDMTEEHEHASSMQNVSVVVRCGQAGTVAGESSSIGAVVPLALQKKGENHNSLNVATTVETLTKRSTSPRNPPLKKSPRSRTLSTHNHSVNNLSPIKEVVRSEEEEREPNDSPDWEDGISRSSLGDFGEAIDTLDSTVNEWQEGEVWAENTPEKEESQEPCPRVVVSVKCSGLPSDCHPVVALFETSKNGHFSYVGQTERHTNSPNPEYLVRFSVLFKPGQRKQLMFNVYNVMATEISETDRLCSAVITLDDSLISYASASSSNGRSFGLIPARKYANSGLSSSITLSIENKEAAPVTSILDGDEKMLSNQSVSIGPSGMVFNSAYVLNPFLVKIPIYKDKPASCTGPTPSRMISPGKGLDLPSRSPIVHQSKFLHSVSFMSDGSNISIDEGHTNYSWLASPQSHSDWASPRVSTPLSRSYRPDFTGPSPRY